MTVVETDGRFPQILSIPRSLKQSSFCSFAVSAINSALNAIDPVTCIDNAVYYQNGCLLVNSHRISLEKIQRIRVVGGGKAACGMTHALWNILGNRIETGIVATHDNSENRSWNNGTVRIIKSSHPLPDESSLFAANQVLSFAADLTENDLLIVLISGGASSLLALPAAGLSLKDKQCVTSELLLSGADIKMLNIVRKHLSAIKGGRLALEASPAQVVSLILSDVADDDLDTIGSGMTAPDSSTYDDALACLNNLNLTKRIPETVISHLENGASGSISETCKPNNPVFERVNNFIIGGNRQAANAADSCLNSMGVKSLLISETLNGEAQDVGKKVAHIVQKAKRTTSDNELSCLIWGGETTVTVKGMGTGGRNQETVLSAAIEASLMDQMNDVVFLSLATDGKDGPTNAAGAAATVQTIRRAKSQNMNPQAFLDDNNSYAFFDTLNELLITGPTQTNAADLLFAFWGKNNI